MREPLILNRTEGIAAATKALHELVQRSPSPVIVAIAGGSASGKTTAVADKIKGLFGTDAVLISMDDYYYGRHFMESEAAQGRILNWDQPEALNLALMREHLHALRSGRAITKPVYDMRTTLPIGKEQLVPATVVIAEGLFVLNDLLAPAADLTIFVDASVHDRLKRRLRRDTRRTGKTAQEIIAYFTEIVQPMHERYIEPTKKNADIIIRN